MISKFKDFTRSEQEIFLQSIKDEKYELLFELDLASGLRLGEILALRWKDIDIHNKVIHINQSVVRTRPANSTGSKKTTLMFSTSKNSYSNRKIPIPSNVFERILSYKTQQAIKVSEEKSLVFVSSKSTPVDPRTIIRAFHRIVDKAGLEHANFHSLRHFNATMMMNYGVPVKIASTMLGHSTTAITQDLYQHVLYDKDHEAAEIINQALFNGRNKK